MKKFGLDWEEKTFTFQTRLTTREFDNFINKKGYSVSGDFLASGSGFISTYGKSLNVWFEKKTGHMNKECYILRFDK